VVRIAAVAILAFVAASIAAQQVPLDRVDPTGAAVTFWYQHPGDRDRAMQKLIAEFNATNPWRITVTGEYAGTYDEIYNKMIAAIAAGNPPQLAVAYQNQAATYEVSGALVDLNPYVSDPKWGLGSTRADFVPGFIDQDVNRQFGGARLGFPPNRSIEVLYYDEAWLRKLGAAGPPATWAEFEELCRRATDAKAGTYGYAIDPFDASHLFAMVITFGGNIAAPGGGYRFDTPQMRSVMQMLQRLYANGWAKKIAQQYGYQTEFGSARALFSISSTSGIPFYDAAVKANPAGPFPWSIAAVPQSRAGGQAAIDLYGASWSVPESTPRQELAAWLFIRWFCEPKQQAAWAEISGYFPVRRSAGPLMAGYLAANPLFAKAWDLLGRATLESEPPYAGYDLVRDKELAALGSILNGADIGATLARLDAEAARLYRQSAP